MNFGCWPGEGFIPHLPRSGTVFTSARWHTSCGAALRSGQRIIVPDAEDCDFMAGSADLDHYHLSGIRAVQSTPLVSRSGELLGMISTHWREPHHPSEGSLRLLDMLARQGADLLERNRNEAARLDG